MGLIHVTPFNLPSYLTQILKLEATARYPLGDDFFTIDHGTHYLEFFNRLGQFRYYAWTEGETLAAVVCTILRQIPSGAPGKLIPAWYLCDLKVHPQYRGKKIPLRIMKRIFFRHYLHCTRGYAISMNGAGNRLGSAENRIVRLSKHFNWIPIKKVTQLCLWELDDVTMAEVQSILEKHRGSVRFLSLQGIKDIRLESTQQPMHILHAQFGPLADITNSVEHLDSAAKYMFCSPHDDHLTHELCRLGLQPSSSASIISHHMGRSDWQWVLTSDI